MNYGRYVRVADMWIPLCAKNTGGEGLRRQRHRRIRIPLEYKINLCVLCQLVSEERESAKKQEQI